MPNMIDLIKAKHIQALFKFVPNIPPFDIIQKEFEQSNHSTKHIVIVKERMRMHKVKSSNNECKQDQL